MDDLAFRPAGELAAAIRRRELSSREALDHLLARVERLDGPLGAVVTIDVERARAEAGAADEALAAGAEVGPLHGVPMTVKDSFSTAGMRTTSGAEELRDHVPDHDAAPVRALRDAGAVVFGKTNLPTYAADVQSYNPVFGVTANPWDLSRTCGGSSGGSAAALAAGFTPLELGSDIGGSIRNPAHTCGVVGHKPSYGIVPSRGQIPGPPGTLTQADIAVAGPLARTVADLELALDVLAGPDEWHAPAWRLELPPARRRSLEGYRVAAWLDDPACPVSREVRDLLERAALALSDAGAKVDVDARPPIAFDYAARVYHQLLQAAQCGGQSRAAIEELAATAAAAGPDDDSPRVRLARDLSQRHRAWLSANERRLQMRARWAEFFTGFDALLCPVTIVPAIPHDHSTPDWARTVTVDGAPRPYWDQVLWAGLTGVAYLPATVVPVGRTAGGLPVGVQVAGAYLEDRTTLHLAGLLAELLGGFEAPPGF